MARGCVDLMACLGRSLNGLTPVSMGDWPDALACRDQIGTRQTDQKMLETEGPVVLRTVAPEVLT